MAERLAPGDYDQLHHFVAAGVWDAAPLEKELLVQADKLVGGSDAVLVIDDTAVPKKGKHSVGVAWQYASALGKNADCQTLVSLTLARDEVPVMVALRLFLPKSWTSDLPRLKRAGVAVEYRTARTKPEIALAEIDRLIATGVRFACVLADAGYGLSAPFRHGLTARLPGRRALSRVAIPGPRAVPAGNGRWEILGELTIHDVTRPVSLDMEFAGISIDPWGKVRSGFHCHDDLRPGGLRRAVEPDARDGRFLGK